MAKTNKNSSPAQNHDRWLKIMIDILLRNIENAAEQHNLSKMEFLINQLLEIAQIPIIKIAPGLEVQRIRNNYHGEIFYSESEISFRMDVVNIKEFGRCNFPNSGKFYCSLSSKYINEIRLVNVLETNKIFRENLSIKKRQIFTSGQWICQQPLFVAVFPFNKYAKGSNREIQQHASKYEEKIESFGKTDRENSKKILPFISYYLGKKKINSQWDYLISAFFSELVLAKYDIDGILYPSSRVNFKTYNLVLEPYALNKLKFSKSAMFELFLNRKKGFIDNIADGEIESENKIFWTQIDRTSNKILDALLK